MKSKSAIVMCVIITDITERSGKVIAMFLALRLKFNGTLCPDI